MKNVKLNLKKGRKAGFSLVEMLVVIAIIGIIAAIAIPNIGSVNTATRIAAAQRNAQQIASVLNSAIAAGADSSGWTTANLITLAADGVSPTDGPFANKLFTTGTIDPEEAVGIEDLLSYDSANESVVYDSTATPTF